MDIIGEAVSNPLSEDELKEDTDAVLAPDLLLVRLYGGKLMQLGAFMPPLLIFFAGMNGYNRADTFMPWEQEARCTVDERAPFFQACAEEYEASGKEATTGVEEREHCYAVFCSVPDDTVHTDNAFLQADHHERLAPWSEGQPCPTGYGQRCFGKGEIDPSELEPLNVLYRGLAAIASLFVGAVSFSLRRVTAPGGTLEVLGLGEVRIMKTADRRLKRWQVGMSAFNMLLSMQSIRLMIIGIPMEGPIYMFVWPCAFTWYLALKLASILVTDAVLEVRKEVVSTAVLDKKWDESVVPKVLQLALKTFPDLSHGFGGGLFMCALGFWTFSASAFASGLTGSWGFSAGVIRSFALFCFPLLIALDVASASSSCDSLMNELNDKRLEAMGLETDQKLQVLERALSLKNAGQGIGFSVHGVVVDRKMLSRVFFLVTGTVGTIVPVILALQPEPALDLQLSPCSYNMSLNNIMAGL
jgi:hypothetical protein